jgi:hypothetical protein
MVSGKVSWIHQASGVDACMHMHLTAPAAGTAPPWQSGTCLARRGDAGGCRRVARAPASSAERAHHGISSAPFSARIPPFVADPTPSANPGGGRDREHRSSHGRGRRRLPAAVARCGVRRRVCSSKRTARADLCAAGGRRAGEDGECEERRRRP